MHKRDPRSKTDPRPPGCVQLIAGQAGPGLSWQRVLMFDRLVHCTAACCCWVQVCTGHSLEVKLPTQLWIPADLEHQRHPAHSRAGLESGPGHWWPEQQYQPPRDEGERTHRPDFNIYYVSSLVDVCRVWRSKGTMYQSAPRFHHTLHVHCAVDVSDITRVGCCLVDRLS